MRADLAAPRSQQGQPDKRHALGHVALQRVFHHEAVAQGLADVRAGRVISDEELLKQLDAEFGPLEADLRYSIA